MRKEYVLSEIRRTATANGGVPLGLSRFSQETGIKEADWRGKIWARWGDAVREAGFEPNQLQTAYDENQLIEKFIGLSRELGHFPVAAEVDFKARRRPFPWYSTFAQRFGSKVKLAAKIAEYCSTRSGYDDIIALCRPIAEHARDDGAQDESEREEVIGFVYLMKSGKYYKIGYSNAAGRREYELAIRMPESSPPFT